MKLLLAQRLPVAGAGLGLLCPWVLHLGQPLAGPVVPWAPFHSLQCGSTWYARSSALFVIKVWHLAPQLAELPGVCAM